MPWSSKAVWKPSVCARFSTVKKFIPSNATSKQSVKLATKTEAKTKLWNTAVWRTSNKSERWRKATPKERINTAHLDLIRRQSQVKSLWKQKKQHAACTQRSQLEIRRDTCYTQGSASCKDLRNTQMHSCSLLMLRPAQPYRPCFRCSTR